MGASVIPSLIPLFVVMAMKRAERQIHRQLADAKAFTAESAIPLAIGRSMERRRLEALIGRGAVRVNASGHHFLDTEGWERHLRARQQRVSIALSIVLTLLGIGVAVLLTRS